MSPATQTCDSHLSLHYPICSTFFICICYCRTSPLSFHWSSDRFRVTPQRRWLTAWQNFWSSMNSILLPGTEYDKRTPIRWRLWLENVSTSVHSELWIERRSERGVILPSVGILSANILSAPYSIISPLAISSAWMMKASWKLKVGHVSQRVLCIWAIHEGCPML